MFGSCGISVGGYLHVYWVFVVSYVTGGCCVGAVMLVASSVWCIVRFVLWWVSVLHAT